MYGVGQAIVVSQPLTRMHAVQNCKCPMSRKILLMRCTIAEMDLLIKNAKTRIMAALEDDDDEAAIIT
jgi:hypothetical protein